MAQPQLSQPFFLEDWVVWLLNTILVPEFFQDGLFPFPVWSNKPRDNVPVIACKKVVDPIPQAKHWDSHIFATQFRFWDGQAEAELVRHQTLAVPLRILFIALC